MTTEPLPVTLENLLTVGLAAQPINGSNLTWNEAALIAHRIAPHLISTLVETQAEAFYGRRYVNRLREIEEAARKHLSHGQSQDFVMDHEALREAVERVR